MNEVFRVELFSGKPDRWCELALPASYYGLQDALDKLQMLSLIHISEPTRPY